MHIPGDESLDVGEDEGAAVDEVGDEDGSIA